MDEKWYAVYTKPRWEKKVAEALTKTNITNYCPINKVVRQWSDRKRIVHEPLFTSYVFVHTTDKKFTEVKQIYGVINLVYWLGKPAVIKDEDIDVIKAFLNEHRTVQLEKRVFEINETIRVATGTFMNKEGTVVAVKNNTIKVALPSLGYVMYAEIVKSNAIKNVQ